MSTGIVVCECFCSCWTIFYFFQTDPIPITDRFSTKPACSSAIGIVPKIYLNIRYELFTRDRSSGYFQISTLILGIINFPMILF